MDHGTIAEGLAEQDSLVEKGHRVHISLKAALPGSDTQQEVAARQMYVAGSLSQRRSPDNATPSPNLLLASSPMIRIKVRI